MAQSLSLLLVHVVFSTKDRFPFINPKLQPQLFPYLAGVVRQTDCECLRAGGFTDHVHLAVCLGRTQNIAKVVEQVKSASTRWLKSQPDGPRNFSWQRGYGAFSVGPSDTDALLHYIDNQEEHHRKRTFQEEYRAFLKKYNIPFDERYVWD